MNKRILQLMLIAMTMVLATVTTAAGQALDNDLQWEGPCGSNGGPPWMLAQVFSDDSLMPPGGAPGFPGGDPRQFAEQRKHLEQFRMFELLKLLDLNNDQEIDFLTAFRQMRDEQSEFEQEKSVLIDRLRDEISAETITREKVDQVTDDLAGLHKRRTESMEQFFRKMKQTLTPEQMAKFIVFEERFEFELLRKLRGFHKGRDMKGIPDPGR